MPEHEIAALREAGIYALEQRPDDDGPVAVLSHGIAADHTEDRSPDKPGLFDLLVDKLAAAGIGTIRFDFRGHGRSTDVDGYTSIRSETADLTDVVADAVRRGVRIKAVVGASFGACATGELLSGDDAPDVDYVALVNPVLRPFETFISPGSHWARQSFHDANLERLRHTGKLLLDEEFPLGTDFVADVRDTDTAAAFASFTGAPVSVIHGTADSYVPFHYSFEFVKASGASLLAIPGAEHGFGDIRDRRYVTSFIADSIAWSIGRGRDA